MSSLLDTLQSFSDFCFQRRSASTATAASASKHFISYYAYLLPLQSCAARTRSSRFADAHHCVLQASPEGATKAEAHAKHRATMTAVNFMVTECRERVERARDSFAKRGTQPVQLIPFSHAV
jgi:hypothetical protein